MNPVLTQKELWALEDQLGQERLLVDKFMSCAQQIDDTELQGLCIQIAQQHREHFYTLLNHLNQQETQQVEQSQQRLGH